MNNTDKAKPQHEQHHDTQPRKRNLLLMFIVFIAWIAGIGLLVSLFACEPVNDNVSRSKASHLQSESLEDLLIKMIKATNRPLLIIRYSKGEE